MATLLDVSEHGLEVDDRRPVDRFEAADMDAYPSMPSTRTRCRPMGLGRLDALVLNTPASGRLRSPRGCTLKTLRSASCNQVNTMISSPTAIPSRPA